MELKFTLQTKVNKNVATVFDAVVDNDKLTGYFCEKSSGPLEEGKEIIWTFTNFGDIPVEVKNIVPNELIVMEWGWNESNDKTVFTISFEAIDENTTMMKIHEIGWSMSQAGIESSYDNCDGWRHMSMCLKAYLEFGVDMRK